MGMRHHNLMMRTPMHIFNSACICNCNSSNREEVVGLDWSQLSVPTNNNLQFSQPLSGNVLHQAPSGNTPEPPLAPKDPKTFGLLGLLDVVKNQDKDLNMLALGK